MAIRVRTVNGLPVALCAVESDPMPGDIYLDDGVDHALRVKFIRDYRSEGIDFGGVSYPEEDALAESQKVRDAKEELEKRLATHPKPKAPPFRILREGERACPICGCGERQHRYATGEEAPLGHPFPFTRLQRLVARVSLVIWPTKRALYILGHESQP